MLFSSPQPVFCAHSKTIRYVIFIMILMMLLPLAYGQPAWGERFEYNITEELPLWKAYAETQGNGYYDLGDGRSVKLQIFELGGCSKGHPCRSSSGLPLLRPEGCPLSQCISRFSGDPWSFFDFQCESEIMNNDAAALEENYGNLTTLSNEWFELYDTSCILRYMSDSDTWQQREEGVTIVLKTRGFELPPQTILVSDIDSVDYITANTDLDFMQEAVVNFALRGTKILKPTNKYAADFYSLSDLWATLPILTPINVTLSREFLDAIDMSNVNEEWVMGSMSAMSLDLVDDYPSYQQPKYWYLGAGGTVWANIEEWFDTWVTTMSLGRKYADDPDQQVLLMPLTMNSRCRCTQSTDTMLLMQPTVTELLCTSRVTEITRYKCEENGEAYCTKLIASGWVSTGLEQPDGTTACRARNVTKALYETDVGDTQADATAASNEWVQWPSFTPPAFSYPILSPNPSMTITSSPSPSASLSSSR